MLTDLSPAVSEELELELLVVLAPAVAATKGWAAPELAGVYARGAVLLERFTSSPHKLTVLSLSFGAIALFLSAIGIYGVLAYLVTQRTKEIGIRIALGSSARAIFDLVLREGLILIAGGFVLGAVGAIVLRKSLESQLFGVSAADPVVLVAVTGILAAVAIVACALPARRATRIDPIVALSE